MTDDPTAEFLAIEAEARTAAHGNRRIRHLSPECELIGLVGEAEFQRVFGVPLNFNRQPAGDDRIDFVLPLKFTVDVKCARVPAYLIEEQGKVKTLGHIYVLAKYLEESRRAELLGWESGAVLARAPVKDFGKGIMNHYIAREELQPIPILLNRTMKLG